MVQTPTRTNDASMEMMAVRIMTQSLFPRIFPGVCPYCVCFIELQGHCIFGQCADTKVQGAPVQTVQSAGSGWKQRVSTIRIVYGKRGSRIPAKKAGQFF